EHGSVSEARLAEALLSARMRAETVFEKRTRGEWREAKERREGVLADYPKVAAKAATPRQAGSTTKASGPCLGSIAESWKAHKKTRAAKAITESERAVRQFEEMHGTIPAASVTRALVRDFKGALMRLPATIPNTMREKTLPEILAADVDGAHLS